MNYARVFLTVIVILLTFNPIGNDGATTPQATDFPSGFLGQWSGEGKSMGMESKPRMTWERVLAEKFVHLHFRNELKNTQGRTEVFEGHAYYKSIGGGNFTGHWFDSGGAAHPITAVFENSTLDSTWGTEQTQLGRTRYRLADPNSVEIIDTVKLKDGSWREFSRTLLRRQ